MPLKKLAPCLVGTAALPPSFQYTCTHIQAPWWFLTIPSSSTHNLQVVRSNLGSPFSLVRLRWPLSCLTHQLDISNLVIRLLDAHIPVISPLAGTCWNRDLPWLRTPDFRSSYPRNQQSAQASPNTPDPHSLCHLPTVGIKRCPLPGTPRGSLGSLMEQSLGPQHSCGAWDKGREGKEPANSEAAWAPLLRLKRHHLVASGTAAERTAKGRTHHAGSWFSRQPRARYRCSGGNS